jgi:hypothetical protein
MDANACRKQRVRCTIQELEDEEKGFDWIEEKSECEKNWAQRPNDAETIGRIINQLWNK